MKRSVIAVLSLSLLVPEVAFAQPADVASSDKASVLFAQGKRHYDIAEYPAAIASWKESYLLSNEPLLLFNIAQAYRLGGDCAQANRFYLNYKRAVPRPANQLELDRAMEKCAGVVPATGDAPTPPADANVRGTTDPIAPGASGNESTNPTFASTTTSVAPLDTPVTRADDTSRDRGRTFRIAGIAVAGAGGVSGVVGLLFAVSARREADVVEGQRAGTTWDDNLSGHQRDGRDAQTRARIFTIVGAAALVTGGALWWYGRGRSRVNLDVAIGGHASEVSVSCAF